MLKLQEEIENFQPETDAENAEKNSFLQFIAAFGEKVLLRENLPGHLTASAWVVNRERDKVLMIFHNLYKSWSWPGGHADGEGNLLRVALKETTEETSLQHVRVVAEEPFDLNIMAVKSHWKKGKFVPGHLHYNVVYVLEADENEPVKPKEDENSGVMWLDNGKVREYCKNDQAFGCYERIMKKIKERSL